MANELQGSYIHGQTVYALVRGTTGLIWNTVTSAMELYSSAHFSGYAISATEQGTASAYYTANMPAAPAGTYNALFKGQVGANPAETDPTVDVGSVDWNGSAVSNLSDISVSGTLQPIMLQRGVMIPNYPIYLRSSSDHITPFTSGTVSGQISRDGGSFGALQSGAFTEVGAGFYSLQALTSGDLAANTVSLLFTATTLSGGTSDPLPQSFILQNANVSGSIFRAMASVRGITGIFGG